MSPARQSSVHRRHTPLLPISNSRVHRTHASTGIGHIRPRDLVVKPQAPRAPATPSERFVTALLDEDHLGLACLSNDELLHNVMVEVTAAETPGKVEGGFQDPSTWRLVLFLKPDMFMTPLKFTLDVFLGDYYDQAAPTWLTRLRRKRHASVQLRRTYKWLEKFVCELLMTPFTTVPRVETWGDILRYVWRIKEVLEPRGGTRDPTLPVVKPKPRPRRSGNQLVDAMSAMSLSGAPKDEAVLDEKEGKGSGSDDHNLRLGV